MPGEAGLLCAWVGNFRLAPLVNDPSLCSKTKN